MDASGAREGDPVTFNEAQTRAVQIDPQLRAADWKINDRTQVRLEVPVDGYDAEPWNGVTDYCLYDASGNAPATSTTIARVRANAGWPRAVPAAPFRWRRHEGRAVTPPELPGVDGQACQLPREIPSAQRNLEFGDGEDNLVLFHGRIRRL
jgi:hypothetical protein